MLKNFHPLSKKSEKVYKEIKNTKHHHCIFEIQRTHIVIH
jgi:hypothetical protein